jgi:hypothetical protein
MKGTIEYMSGALVTKELRTEDNYGIPTSDSRTQMIIETGCKANAFITVTLW